MSAAPWAAHFGLTRTPFGKSIPARDLFARRPRRGRRPDQLVHSDQPSA